MVGFLAASATGTKMHRRSSGEWPTEDFAATFAERPLYMGNKELCRTRHIPFL
jgi:hypothetical protein